MEHPKSILKVSHNPVTTHVHPYELVDTKSPFGPERPNPMNSVSSSSKKSLPHPYASTFPHLSSSGYNHFNVTEKEKKTEKYHSSWFELTTKLLYHMGTVDELQWVSEYKKEEQLGLWIHQPVHTENKPTAHSDTKHTQHVQNTTPQPRNTTTTSCTTSNPLGLHGVKDDITLITAWIRKTFRGPSSSTTSKLKEDKLSAKEDPLPTRENTPTTREDTPLKRDDKKIPFEHEWLLERIRFFVGLPVNGLIPSVRGELLQKSACSKLMTRLTNTKRLDVLILLVMHMYLKTHAVTTSTSWASVAANDRSVSNSTRLDELARSLAKWNMGMIIQSSSLPFPMKWMSTWTIYQDTSSVQFPQMYLMKRPSIQKGSSSDGQKETSSNGLKGSSSDGLKGSLKGSSISTYATDRMEHWKPYQKELPLYLCKWMNDAWHETSVLEFVSNSNLTKSTNLNMTDEKMNSSTKNLILADTQNNRPCIVNAYDCLLMFNFYFTSLFQIWESGAPEWSRLSDRKTIRSALYFGFVSEWLFPWLWIVSGDQSYRDVWTKCIGMSIELLPVDVRTQLDTFFKSVEKDRHEYQTYFGKIIVDLASTVHLHCLMTVGQIRRAVAIFLHLDFMITSINTTSVNRNGQHGLEELQHLLVKIRSRICEWNLISRYPPIDKTILDSIL